MADRLHSCTCSFKTKLPLRDLSKTASPPCIGSAENISHTRRFRTRFSFSENCFVRATSLMWAQCESGMHDKNVSVRHCAAVGRTPGSVCRHAFRNWWNSLDQTPDRSGSNKGGSFCAMWYNAAIAFNVNNGSMCSASPMGLMPSDQMFAWPSYCPSSIAGIIFDASH